MKKIIIFLILFLSIQLSIFSQVISVYDHRSQTSYQVDLPDTLYVVFGNKYEDGDYAYLDYRYFVGVDIFLLDKPFCSEVFLSESEDWGKRIDLDYCREVFIDENIIIEHSLDIYVFYKSSKISKFGFSYPILRKIVLIPYDVEGNRMTEIEYFNSKFALQNTLKLFNFKTEKKD